MVPCTETNRDAGLDKTVEQYTVVVRCSKDIGSLPTWARVSYPTKFIITGCFLHGLATLKDIAPFKRMRPYNLLN